MSYDYKSSQYCPHVCEVPSSPGSDLRTLDVEVHGTGLRLFKGGLEIPKFGLSKPAQCSTGIGPFLVESHSRTLEVTTPLGSFSLTFPVGVLTPEKFVTSFSRYLLDRGVGLDSKDGSLVFTELSSTGPSSTLILTGPASKILGLRQSGSMGIAVVPGWSETSVEGVGGSRLTRLTFNSPVSPSTRFFMSYFSDPEVCPRCQGSGVENTICLNDSESDLSPVEGYDLLYQICQKAILTDLGSNPYHLWYGSTLYTARGKKATPALSMSIEKSITDTLQKIQSLQTAQAKYQKLDPKERLYNYQVSVTPDSNDPTTFYLDITLVSYSNEPVDLQIIFSVGGVQASSSNGLYLGATT